MKRPVQAIEVELDSQPPAPEPYASRLGPYQGRSLGDHFGLTQFGARLEILEPGRESALRHWHSDSDELVYILDGELVLVTDDGESVLTAGMCIGFKAGVENAHHLINRSGQEARFLAIGTRTEEDQCHYPDDDFQWLCDENGNWYAATRDGTRL